MVAVQTDKLRPGLILAEEVRDINGRLLLASGNEIGSNHIRIFKIWGVPEVIVAGNGRQTKEDDPAVNPERVEQVQEEVKTLFRHCDLTHPAIKEIYRLAVQFRISNQSVDTALEKGVFRQDASHEDRTVDLIEKIDKEKIILPEIPSIVFELNEVIANPMSSADNIARVVNTSPSLTALLLKIVNSSFYGFKSKIATVSHAVSLIGTREISGLALGICVLSIFKKIPKESVNMYSFLKHSLVCGILSRILAARKNLQHTEQLFVSGLLHDLGRLILYIHFPEMSQTVLARSRAASSLLYEEENAYLGCDHALVGSHLMKRWKLPLILENNVACHHKPSEARLPVPATLVHLADIIVNGLGIGTSGEKLVPPLDYDAWENLDFSPNMFEPIIGQALHQFKSLQPILNVEKTP
jgi:HD-like signal output (HDOD) protein